MNFGAWIPGYEGLYRITPQKEIWSFLTKRPKQMKLHQKQERVNLTKNGAQIGHNVELLFLAAYPSATLPRVPVPEFDPTGEDWIDVPDLADYVFETVRISNKGRIWTPTGLITQGAPHKQYRTYAGLFIHQLIHLIKFGTMPHPNKHVHAPHAPRDSDGIFFNDWDLILEE